MPHDQSVDTVERGLRAHLGRAKPDHYLTVEKGPPLPPKFEKVTGKHPFFFKNWKWNVPLVSRRAVEMYPGCFTFDREYLNYLTIAQKEGLELFKAQVEDDGSVGATGIHKKTSTFGTVSGFMQDPMGYPLKDNSRLRDSLGLPNEWRRERDRLIYREWLHLFFSEWMDRPIRVTDKSKFGMPYMEYDKRIKAAIIEKRLEEGTFPRILQLLSRRDYRALRKDHQLIIAGLVGKRGQSDAAEKIRMVADQEYAASGGARGQLLRADKRVVIDGVSYDALSGQRARAIVGYSALANSIGQIMSTGHLYSAYERFAPCLKFAELQDKLDDLCENFLPDEPVLTAFAGDVSNFDQCALPEFRYKEFIDVASTYWEDGMIALQDGIHRAPYFAPPLSNKGECYWSGNPDDPADFNSTGALKSGDNKVTIIGIIEIVAEILTICDYAFGNVLGNVASIMKGDYHIRLWDKGDDHMVWGSPESIDRYKDFATAEDREGRCKYAYFRVEPEDGWQFIGKITQRLGPRKFRALARIHALHEKSMCNEHSVGSVFRPGWALGGFARKELYSSSPMYDDYVNANREWWSKSGCAVKYGTLDAILDKGMDQASSFWRMAKTAIDLDVFFNPSKADYRYSDSEISPEVLALFKSTISQERTSFWAHRMYSGKIANPFKEA